ncbi:hypothetical protein [Paraburkholderia sp. RL17-337-BIB-A]|jgi:hypothetical protein|uniref:hypothetical protein n=1 Tax=Paraburkholderia sp. RL17-337-BIB-A TaxID=3031636 RepID=UPI0038B7814A
MARTIANHLALTLAAAGGVEYLERSTIAPFASSRPSPDIPRMAPLPVQIF